MATRKGAKKAGSRAGKKGAAKASSEKPQVPPTRMTGATSSATGQAIRDAAGEEEIPQGEDRGSKVPIKDAPEPDMLGGTNKLSEAQAAPARFVSNGSVDASMLPSPSGPVPASAAGITAEDAEKQLEQRQQEHDAFVTRRSGKERLSDARIDTIGRAELYAISRQRGYDIPEAGTRATREAFRKAQEKDDSLEDAE